jgi:hypothetical protein
VCVCVCVCMCVCEGMDVRCTTRSKGTVQKGNEIQSQDHDLQAKLKHYKK